MRFDPKAQRILDTIAVEACVGLFGAYGVALEPVAHSAQAHEGRVLYCGVIGFTGDGLRGTCLLATTDEPLGKSNPIGGRPRDWIAELSNQLVGRIKNRLLAHGAEIYTTTPVVLRGEHLAPMPRNELEPSSFRSENGAVYVWVEVETEEGFELSETPAARAGMSEGDALLF
jgi:CheY-specific phosphatase CheX